MGTIEEYLFVSYSGQKLNRREKSIIQKRLFTKDECKKILECETTPFTVDNLKSDWGIETGEGWKRGMVDVKYINVVPYPLPVEKVDECVENRWFVDRLTKAIFDLNKRYYNFRDITLDNFWRKDYQIDEGIGWHVDSFTKYRFGGALFLNTDYEGGELRLFEGQVITVKPKIGVLVTWPAWTWHTVEKITKGERKIVLLYAKGPSFNFFNTRSMHEQGGRRKGGGRRWGEGGPGRKS